ncbi:hypothetical protein [Aequorivita sp. CIP111184]|uniref:hypothetical protein n=1 Tax=Aequorivita sp. CIP111184 TaxID=2211356 RepID=UPI000DBBBC2A|nr:hypothetical protein [Aequorivita sp. CIP111184]SRX54393.1 hypothetical protein AEQU1_01403 [Aequorivita sp. CIP111184]
MENREEIVFDQIKNLITISCKFDRFPAKEFSNFHKMFLKFFFNAIDINIDYEDKLISIWNSKPLTTNPVRLFDLNEAIADKVSYSNLEETLTGCVEEGKLQHSFYKKMLFEFGDYPQKDGDVLSA